MIDRLITACVSSVVRRSGYWTFFAIVVFAVCLLVGSQLSTRLDKADFLPDTVAAPDSVDIALMQRFGGAGRIVVYIEAPDTIHIDVAGPLMEELSSRAASIPGVSEVRAGPSRELTDYLADKLPERLALYLPTEHLKLIGDRISREGIERSVAAGQPQRTAAGGTQDATQVPTVASRTFRLPEDPLGVVGIAATTAGRITGSSPIRTTSGYYSDRRQQRFFLVADLEQQSESVERWARVTEDFEQLVADVSADNRWSSAIPDVRIGVIGRPISYASASSTLSDDVRRIGLSAAIVIALILIVFFRSLIVPVQILLPIGFAMAVAAAVGYLIWGEVSTLSLVFVGVLIGIGVDFGIHAITHYRLVIGRRGHAQSLSHHGSAGPAVEATTPASVARGVSNYPDAHPDSHYPDGQPDAHSDSIHPDAPADSNYPDAHPDSIHPAAEAISFALRQPGRAIVLSGLTSTAAFLSMGILPYPVTRQVAVMAGVGIIATLIGTFIILPLALFWTDRIQGRRQSESSDTEVAKLQGAGKGTGVIPWSVRWIEWLPQRGLVVWILLVAAALPAALSIEFEPHPWSLALRGNPKTAELNRLNESLGISFAPLLLVSSGDTREEAIERDRQAISRLRPGAQRAEVVTVESLSNWLPPADQQDRNADYLAESGSLFTRARFVADYDAAVALAEVSNPHLTSEYRDAIAEYLLPSAPVSNSRVTLDDLPREMDRYLVSVGGGFVAISYLYTKRFPWANDALEPLRDTMRLLDFDELDGTRLIGDALSSVNHKQALTAELFKAVAVASVLVILLLLLQFRNPRLVLLCLVPPVCGVSAALLMMAALNIELNMMTLAIAPLLIGIGIDDGIHIVDRLRTGQTITSVFREAGSGLTYTTLTSIAAFACLGLARFDGLQDLGLLGGVGMAVALLASVHAVPLLARQIDNGGTLILKIRHEVRDFQ